MVVELAGLPAAGKTSSAAAVKAILEAEGIATGILDEAAARCPLLHRKGEWEFSAWTLFETLAGLLSSSGAHYELLIVDRGLFDNLCWLRWFRNRSAIPRDTAILLNSLASHSHWQRHTLLTFVLEVKYTTALRRRQGQAGTIVNQVTFAELVDAYRSVLNSSFALHFPNLISVATDDLSEDEVHFTLASTIRDSFGTSGIKRRSLMAGSGIIGTA